MHDEDLKNYLIVLDNPSHLYHGNHWYHFGEHFLSRSNELQEILQSLPFPGSTTKNGNHLYLLSNNRKLLNMMSSFTFFLLLLTVWSPKFQSISVIRINQQYLQPAFYHYEDWKDREVRTILGSETIFHYDPTQSIYSRFTQTINEETTKENPQNPSTMMMMMIPPLKEWTGEYLASIGEYPINSFDWFQSFQEIDDLRWKIQMLCIGSEVFEDQKFFLKNRENNSLKKRLIVYQRDQTRKLLDFENLIQKLEEILILEWEIIPVVHSETRNPCFLYEIMKKAEGFLSLHGFQFTAMMFLPPKSIIIEIFPYKYFKPSYFPLAVAFGHIHIWFQAKYITSELLRYISLKTCMEHQSCRSFARNHDVLLSWTEINAILNMLWILYLRETSEAVGKAIESGLLTPHSKVSLELDTDTGCFDNTLPICADSKILTQITSTE